MVQIMWVQIAPLNFSSVTFFNSLRLHRNISGFFRLIILFFHFRFRLRKWVVIFLTSRSVERENSVQKFGIMASLSRSLGHYFAGSCFSKCQARIELGYEPDQQHSSQRRLHGFNLGIALCLSTESNSGLRLV